METEEKKLRSESEKDELTGRGLAAGNVVGGGGEEGGEEEGGELHVEEKRVTRLFCRNHAERWRDSTRG